MKCQPSGFVGCLTRTLLYYQYFFVHFASLTQRPPPGGANSISLLAACSCNSLVQGPVVLRVGQCGWSLLLLPSYNNAMLRAITPIANDIGQQRHHHHPPLLPLLPPPKLLQLLLLVLVSPLTS